jgi:hypothetical protein
MNNKEKQNIVIILAIIFGIFIFYIFFIKEKFTQYITDTLPHDTPIKSMVKSILAEFNKQHNTDYHLLAIDRVNRDIVDVEHLRYNMRIYVHNKRMAEGRNMYLAFTVSKDKHIKVETINISNAVNLPNNIWTNLSTRNGLANLSELPAELINIDGIEQTDIDYQPVKINGHCVRNTQDFYKAFVPNDYNDGAIIVKNKYAVSFAGIVPYDNPTVARQEKLDYSDPMSSLFRPAGFDGADGRVAY